MLKNLYPFGISVILILLIQLFNLSHDDSFTVSDDVMAKSTDIKEIQRYLNEYNPQIGKKFANKKIHIDNALNSANKITVVNSMQHDEWIGKKRNLKSADRDFGIDSSILNLANSLKPNSRIGYIQLKSIRYGAYQSFMKAMESIAGQEGFDTLYLDMRKCNAGQDVEAIKIANQLVFEEDVTLIKEMFFNGTINKISSRGKVFFPLKKIILLMNSETSGVSEFMIQMLQNGKQVTTIGGSTAGNNLIMRFFPLSSGKYAFFPIGYYCDDCEKVNMDYDQDKSIRIDSDIKMGDDELNTFIRKKFKI